VNSGGLLASGSSVSVTSWVHRFCTVTFLFLAQLACVRSASAGVTDAAASMATARRSRAAADEEGLDGAILALLFALVGCG